MDLQWIERLVHIAGGLLAFSALVVIFYGIYRGTRRQAGRTTGQAGAWLRSPWFYLITSALFFGACYYGWKPLPFTISPLIQVCLLAVGSLLYFPGMALVIWARMALGENYLPSSGLGVQLFAGHQLITSGPYAIVRHPMYTGLILAALGSLFIYKTWTTLVLACFTPLITVRAYREEIALAAEFGEQWRAYCMRVPKWIPRIKTHDDRNNH